MPENIDILLIEDNPGDADLIKIYLQSLGSVSIKIDHVTRISNALGYLDNNTYGVILLDLTLPDAQNLDGFHILQDKYPNIPIIVITVVPDEEFAIETLSLGVQDYLSKDHLNRNNLIRGIRYAIERHWSKKEKTNGKMRTMKGLFPAINIFVWIIGLLFLMDNLGFNISGLIAGLGIGGLAVAMAAQAILGDLFSYFSILLDRPFELDDFIIIGDYMGTIEHIGIKTTRIRSLGGEQLIFSNSDLTSSRVRNYKRMQQRRIVFNFGITYGTEQKKLKEVPQIIKSIVDNIEHTRFDRAHFAKYGDFSLDFEVAYYVLTGDYNKYMDLQQEINLGINEEFAKRKIEFAFPTQTIYMNK